jgi:hypothetical protein
LLLVNLIFFIILLFPQFIRLGSKVVMQGPAKPLFVGSIPSPASKILIPNMNLGRSPHVGYI